MASAKIALGLLLDMILRPMPRFKIISRITLAAIAAWSVGAVLAITFECPLPRPWSLATGGCAVLYGSVEAFNIVLDFVVIALATALTLKVQISAEKRWRIIGLFATRFVVVVVAVCQAISTGRTSAATDLTWAMANPTIWTQALVSMSTITACIPGMKQTLQDLSSGLTRMVIPNGLQFPSNSLAARGQSTITSTLQRSQRKGKASAILDDDETAIWHATSTISIRGPRNSQMDRDFGVARA
ncbi:hypothetical protein LTR35_017677 [Friedmanniomyces endolithicus]|nr:hypothetical protein LTR35_017677 [Friedmanniomyces endolithicus]KAK0268604.1 hypothetical protein LTS00_017519 [Friedmanniomyces endolithicus]KAK0971733.1 hypothetical protein LTR54_017722 [Friedmanniomyces endolithicus]